MNKLTNEQIDYIIKEHGASKEIIERIEAILNTIEFQEEEYLELIIEIASAYETNELKKSIIIKSNKEIYKNLKEIIIDVLNYKLRSINEKQKVYKLINNTIKDIKLKKYV